MRQEGHTAVDISDSRYTATVSYHKVFIGFRWLPMTDDAVYDIQTSSQTHLNEWQNNTPLQDRTGPERSNVADVKWHDKRILNWLYRPPAVTFRALTGSVCQPVITHTFSGHRELWLEAQCWRFDFGCRSILLYFAASRIGQYAFFWSPTII